MKLSFVVVLHNRVDLARATVDSLRDTVDLHGHELLLIDNASTDETGEWLSTLSARVRSFRNEENLGFAAANNQGARAATGELLVLLNSDLILTSGWIEPMLEAFDRVPRAGVVGNVQLRVQDSSVDHAGIVFREGGYPRHWREPVELAQAAELREFPAVTAACCLVPRDWFLATGGFDEGYRNGFEDVDLCLRAREDGRVNLVAGRSVIRHHVGASAGRGTYEFRNAERFLARWGQRTRELEFAWLREQAHRDAARAADDYLGGLRTAPWKFKASLAGHHRRVRREQHAELSRRRAPLRVAVDLERMQPGGGHGGIKPGSYGLLRALAGTTAPHLQFAVFCRPELRDEIKPMLRAGDGFASPTDTPQSVGAEVLWCPFGHSRHLAGGVPAVSWIVDVLHRDLPAALPLEEVNFRESWFQQVVKHATFLQCNSRHVAARVQELYGVEPTRCFHAYQPVQERLVQAPEDASRPEGFPRGSYFFYPANFWPHKNHETLLLAYRQYRRAAGDEAWNLVFTGHPDARQARLQEMATALGFPADAVHFAGHLGTAEFAAVWRRAGALVFPSLHEGFGIPPLEAMRLGVPVLCSRATSLPEVCGDAPLYVDPLNVDELATALQRIASEDGLREELVARGRRRVHEFSLEVEGARLAHFLLCAARGLVP